MNQCLRCKKSCGIDAVYCDDCRSQLRARLQPNDATSPALLPRQAVGAVLSAVRFSRRVAAKTIPSLTQDGASNFGSKDALLPHMPTLPVSNGMNQALTEDKDMDNESSWVNQADPLMMRHLPSSTEGAFIEEEDIRRAIAQGQMDANELESTRFSEDNHTSIASPSLSGRPISLHVRANPAETLAPQVLSPVSRPSVNFPGTKQLLSGRLRVVLMLLAVLAMLALVTDGVFVFLDITHHSSPVKAPNAFPTLTITPGTAHLGQIVLLHINNFSSSAHVLLTHDMLEAVRTDRDSPVIKLGAKGNGDVQILIEDSWGPGFHMILAEDTTTHYTASTILQVVSDLPLRPPHLLVSTPDQPKGLQGVLRVGAAVQEANTLQTLILHNTGGSWISWNATSNQPWLMLAPQHGVFRDGQSIFAAVSRAHLKPGDYTGTITIVSNTGNPVAIQVKMTVLQLPASDIAVSPVMVVTPPVLSFTSIDGGTDPTSQLLTISNPGSHPLSWSLAFSDIQDSFNQDFSSQDVVNWSSTSSTSGTVSPGTSEKIRVFVHNHDLLPGVYSALLTFTSGRDTLNTPQVGAISLTVQPRCGVETSLGDLSFTTTFGHGTAGNQVLNLNTTAGCTGPINWQSFSSASWLGITPASGQLQANLNVVTTVRVNAAGLQPGTYTGFILFLTDLRSETLMVQLTILSPSSTAVGQPAGPTSSMSGTPPSSTGTPSPTAAILGVSPLSLQFTTTQGQNSPPSQSLTLSNAGGGSLYWQATTNSSGSPSWLNISPIGGTITAGGTAQVTVNVTNTTGMAPGTYGAQVIVTATDSSGSQVQGSPKTIAVTLTVLPACSLQVAPSSLSFTASLVQPNPPAQDIVLQEKGNCAYPISWFASVNAGSRKWLILSATSGTDSGKGSTIVVHVNTSGLLPGVYNGYVTFSAIGNGGAIVRNSPQTISVTLTVLL